MEWPLLAGLAPDERDRVLAAARRRSYRKGEVLFHEGDAADALHLVVYGRLAMQVTTSEGERATLNVLGPGSHVGELALVPRSGRQPRSATVVALEHTQTLTLTAAAFAELCRRSPAVQSILVEILAMRVKELSSLLVESMYLGLDRRLYRCLLRLAEVYGDTDPPVVPLTQEQLADLVGGTRPSINQVLQRLADQHVIELHRGRVVLLDIRALARKAGEP